MIEFRIIDEPDQRFSTIINGQRVTIRLWYSVFNLRWSFDLSIDNEPVLKGRRLVQGVDLLEPFTFNLGSIFVYSSDGFPPDRQTLVNGVVRMYHASEEEVNAAISA